MGTAFKTSNFICAASFLRRLLELPDMSSEKNTQLRLKVRSLIMLAMPICLTLLRYFNYTLLSIAEFMTDLDFARIHTYNEEHLHPQ